MANQFHGIIKSSRKEEFESSHYLLAASILFPLTYAHVALAFRFEGIYCVYLLGHIFYGISSTESSF